MSLIDIHSTGCRVTFSLNMPRWYTCAVLIQITRVSV